MQEERNSLNQQKLTRLVGVPRRYREASQTRGEVSQTRGEVSQTRGDCLHGLTVPNAVEVTAFDIQGSAFRV